MSTFLLLLVLEERRGQMFAAGSPETVSGIYRITGQSAMSQNRVGQVHTGPSAGRKVG